MKTGAIIFLLYWMAYYNSWSQEYIVQVKGKVSENWKYANLKGEIIINNDFPVSFEFSEDGVALVYYPKKNAHYIINLKGEIINTDHPDFDPKSTGSYSSGFSNGLLVSRIEEKYGALNTEGKLVIAAKYDNLSDFNNDYAIGRIDKTFYVVDKTGNEILVKEPEIVDIKHFSEGLAPFRSIIGLKGFIGTDGKITIPAIFSDVGYFSSGLAWGRVLDNIGFIDHNGKWVIAPEFESAKNFDELSGLALVKSEKQRFYVDKNGEIVSFKNIKIQNSFKEGLAIGRKNSYYGFYNNRGEWEIEPKFEDLRDFRNGYAPAKKNNFWGIIDRKGNWVIKPVYNLIRDVIVINK